MTRTTARPARALGIDIGTSGVRAAAICEDGMPLEMEAVRFERPDRMRDPALKKLALAEIGVTLADVPQANPNGDLFAA